MSKQMLIGFILGVLVSAGAGVAAQCLAEESQIIPMVRVMEGFSRVELLRCDYVMFMLAGHELICQRGRQRR